MDVTRAQAAFGAGIVIALGMGAYALGLDHGLTSPVDVNVVHEESGELSDLTVDRDGKPVRIGSVQEQWRGAEDADGLYDTDPAPYDREDATEHGTPGPIAGYGETIES